MSRGKIFSEIHISDTEWGPLDILRPIPRDGDYWGSLGKIRGTPWEQFFKVVSGEDFSFALHGYTKALIETIGKSPHALAKLVPDSLGLCKRYQDRTCKIRKPFCRPGKEVPECYEIAIEEPDLEEPLYETIMAWKEGKYVLIVKGQEFSF